MGSPGWLYLRISGYMQIVRARPLCVAGGCRFGATDPQSWLASAGSQNPSPRT